MKNTPIARPCLETGVLIPYISDRQWRTVTEDLAAMGMQGLIVLTISHEPKLIGGVKRVLPVLCEEQPLSLAIYIAIIDGLMLIMELAEELR